MRHTIAGAALALAVLPLPPQAAAHGPTIWTLKETASEA
jgi:hypothetical protein